MLIKIMGENPAHGEKGVSISKIRALVHNYYDRMKKKKGTLSRDLDPRDDTKSAWFTKDRLDELFRANGCNDINNADYGLRVYYGVHKEGILVDENGNEIITDKRYFNQQTVILVVTKKDGLKPDQDQLTTNNFVEIAGILEDPGMGMNHGKLCPPEVCDGSVISVIQ